jgi:Exostosin family
MLDMGTSRTLYEGQDASSSDLLIMVAVQATCGLRFAADLQDKFWPWLYSQPAFRRSQGRDHFLVLSKTWGRAFECEPFKTWVQFRFAPWNRTHADSKWAKFDWAGAENMQKLAHANSHAPDQAWKNNAHAVPYPSAVHYFDGSMNSTLLESLQLQAADGAWQPHRLWSKEREYLASYVGTVWRGARVATDYWRLKVLCAEACHASHQCLANVLDAPPQQPGTPRKAWADFMTGHADFGAFHRDESNVDSWLLQRGIGTRLPQLTYLQSTFCLCPPGDGPTRKGLFDSILFGCIPVCRPTDG